MMYNKSKAVSFIGNSNIDFDNIYEIQFILFHLIRRLYNLGYVTFLCGLQQGFDFIAADTVLRLRRKYPKIRLIAVLPYSNQTSFYNGLSLLSHWEFVERADDVIIISDYYYDGCLELHSNFMIDNCSLVLYYNHDYQNEPNKSIISALDRSVKCVNIAYLCKDYYKQNSKGKNN